MTQLGEVAKTNIPRATFASGIGLQVFCDLLGSKTPPLNDEVQNDDNIVIVGGDLSNKGAQAMTFTVVDQMRRRYPQHDMYLFSNSDFERPEQEKERYSFEILPWGVDQRLISLLESPLPSFISDIFNEIDTEVKQVFSNSEFIIDISGYALSSQWGFERSFSYLSNIILARKKSIPIYILPQSIGPFDYKLFQKIPINILFNIYLSYPKVICSREKEGVKELSSYITNNVNHEFDIVLQNEDYNLNNIYDEIPFINTINIDDNSIGIVPNSKVLDRMKSSEFYALYDSIIESAININKKVYILRHSDQDKSLCREIANKFDENPDVFLLSEDFNPIELELIIEQFDYLIGSRYHSLIHAYKNNRPVIAIGWATKYKELLYDFDQSDYFFDARETIDIDRLKQTIIELNKSYTYESAHIAQRRSDILENDIFEELFSKIDNNARIDE